MEQGNVLGEEFNQYVFDQIDVRQSLNGASGVDNPLSRNSKILNYLNTRNAWVKMASGVALTDKIKDEKLPEGSRGTDRLKSISNDLNSSISELDFVKYNSTGLAKNFVLFNTLSNFGFEGENTYDKIPYTFRSGIQTTQKSWLDVDSSYGLGGTSMGLQPTPGIIDVSIDCINRGSIRKATVTLKAYNIFQFSIIEMLYLRLGYTMMLEWGWDRYVSKIEGDGSFTTETMGNTITEDLWFKDIDYNQTKMIQAIERYREIYHSNYDGFFGKVNNFTWNFNPDGSYDITINLITVGDVVESLKTNVNSRIISKENLEKNQQTLKTINSKLEGSSIYNALGGDILSQYLSSLVINYTSNTTNSELIKFSDITNSIYGNKIPTELEYFITLGDFLDILQEKIIPKFKGKEKEDIIKIDTDRNLNYISCYYNLIPFDPKVCIFTTKYSSQFTNDFPILNFKDHPTGTLDRNLTEKFMEEKEGFVAGKLMNIYLNVDFILKKLNSNIDEKGDLSLYRLIESICSGLNNALGNINNLEPVIKDDKTLVIIDQNPISQIKKFISISDSTQVKNNKTTTQNPFLEVYGYNKGQSNFLKDIKFQTKIDNSLASMISIGATAGGSNTKNSDATAFSKWNLGLKDRFTPPIEEPNDSLNPLKVNDDYINTAKKWAEDNIENNNELISGKYWLIPSNKLYIEDFIFSKNYDLWYPQSKYSKKKAINVWLEKVRKKKRIENQETYDETKLSELANGTYAIILCNVFGRNITITYGGAKETFINSGSNYSDLFNNEDLIKKLKTSYKDYINNLSNTNFTKSQDSSGNIGFIPVSFDLTLEGLSGVKIYNKLNIDTRFLPPNYGKSLDFLITKVNHKISDNNWDTTLGTISTSNIKDNKGVNNTSIIANLPSSPPSTSNYNWLKECPIQNTRILSGIRVTNGQLPDTILKEINNPQQYKGANQSDEGRIRLYPEVTDNLNQLLTSATSQNIILKINSAYRTYEDQLRVINQYGQGVAACPGTSNHGFGLAVDFANINGGRIKPGMKEYDWIKENAPKFGFNRLPWGNKGENWESWHWEYTSISRNLTTLKTQQKSAFEEKKRQLKSSNVINLT